jgi:hypothetical protein
VTLPAGEHADAVVVIRGTATILGEVNSVVVVDGTATLSGATTETLVAVRSPVTLGTGTVVRGDVMTFDSLVTKFGNAQVGGSVRNLAVELGGLGFVLGPVVILWMLGVALTGIVAALLLAAIAARQVRAAGELISHEPLLTAGFGLLGVVLPILIAIPLIVSIVGAPLGLALLFGLWPLVAFLGYLVAGIWLGDLVLRSLTPEISREKPYLAALVGVVLLDVAAIFPPLVMIASFFGYGAVLLLAWRSFRGAPRAAGAASFRSPSSTTPAAPTPVAG